MLSSFVNRRRCDKLAAWAMRIRLVRPVAALCLILLVTAGGRAQTADGEVHLRVMGPDGVPMHDVDVTLELVSRIGTRRAARTGTVGEAIFRRLPAGRHRAVATIRGSELATAEIEVRPAEALFVDVKPGTDGDPAESRIVRRYRLSFGTSFDRNTLEALPGGESVWPLIETVEPFTFSDRMDTGGLSTGQPSLVGSHASSWINTAFYSGAEDVTDVYRGGVPMFYPDLRAVDAMVVTTALAPIEIDTAGPAVTAVTRRPTAQWHGTVAGATVPGAPQSGSASSGVPRIETLNAWSRGGIVLSGPLAKDRAGLVLAGTLIRSDRTERGRTALLPGHFASLFASLVLTPRAGDEVSVMTGFQRAKHAFAGRTLFASRDAVERDSFASFQAAWDRHLPGGASIHAGGAFNSGAFTPDIASPLHGSVERLYDGPIPELAFAAETDRSRWSSNLGFDFASRAVRGAQHALRAGVTGSGASATTRPLDTASGLIGELVGGVPARVWSYGYAGPESRWRETAVGAFIADRITARRLTAEIGVRVDAVSGYAEAARQGITWHTWSPRFAARWTPFGERLAIVGGYGRYHYQLPLSYFAFGDPTGPQGLAYRWTDQNQDLRFQPPERGPLVARTGPGSSDGTASIEPGLRRPRAHEYVIGAETVLTPTWTLRFVGIARREHHLVAGVDVAVAESSYDVRLVADPGLDFGSASDDQQLPIYDRRPSSFGLDTHLLTNPSGLTAGYEGFDLTLEKRVTSRWQLLLGAAACRSRGWAGNRGFQAFENDQGVIGELLTDPNATRVAEGRLFFERGYTIKTSTVYRGPRNTVLGMAARYQDGQHFARMLIVPGLNQGAEAIQALPNGKTRYTFAMTIDGRVEKKFDVGRYRFGAALEAFNLLNTRNEVEENVVSGPAFRAPTAWQPGPVVRLGFDIAF